MAENLTVSVALATRNGAGFIREQLDSILRQQPSVDEIVVSDDASHDSTVDIVKSVADANPQVVFRVLEHPAPLGVTANFETAIRACAGDLVLLCDQDDVWLEQRVARAVAAFRGRPDLLVLHADARLVDAEGRPIGTLFGALGIGSSEVERIHRGDAFELLLRRNVVTGATMAVRRDFALASGPFPESWLHDEWLAILAAAHDGVDVEERQLIEYRQHGSNAVGANTRGLRERLSRLSAPGRPRNARLLARATDLVGRLPGQEEVPERYVSAARAKLDHERFRSGLPARRAARVGGVVREWRRGGYRRFGNGMQDVLRDLVQPLSS